MNKLSQGKRTALVCVALRALIGQQLADACRVRQLPQWAALRAQA